MMDTNLNGTEPVMTRSEVAAYLHVSPGTLANWHTQQRGPKRFLLARKACYLREDVENFVREHIRGDVR